MTFLRNAEGRPEGRPSVPPVWPGSSAGGLQIRPAIREAGQGGAGRPAGKHAAQRRGGISGRSVWGGGVGSLFGAVGLGRGGKEVIEIVSRGRLPSPALCSSAGEVPFVPSAAVMPSPPVG